MESKKDEETRSLLPSQQITIPDKDKENGKSSSGTPEKGSSTNHYVVDDSENTYMSSLMTFLRTLVGTGVLSLPIALKYTGLALGPLLMIFTAILNLAAMHFILNVVAKLNAKFGEKLPKDLQLSEVAYFTFSVSSSKIIRKMAFVMRCVVSFSVVILHVLLCAVYHLFVATNLHRFVINVLPPEEASKVPSLLTFEVALLAFFIPYVFVRRLDLLVNFFIVGNVLAATSLTLIITYCLIDLSKWTQVHSYPLFSTMATIPIGFGIIIFAFEGIQLLLSIRNRMIDKNMMSTKWGVLNVSMLVATLFYLGVGSLGYLRFGDSVESTITLNMPRDRPIFYIAAPLYAIAIFISYGLFFYLIAVIVIESLALSPTLSERPYLMTAVDAIMRISFVLLIFVVATVVPYIDLLVAMTGSLVGAFLCFLLPAVIHAVSYTWDVDGVAAVEGESTGTGKTKDAQSAPKTEPGWLHIGKGPALMVDVVLIIVWAIAFTIGTYATMIYIIREKIRN